MNAVITELPVNNLWSLFLKQTIWLLPFNKLLYIIYKSTK